MTINGQTLTLKLSLTLPSLITQSGSAPQTSPWISKLLKIEGAGQIDFCSYQLLLLLTQSENMMGKHRASLLHLGVSAGTSFSLMGLSLTGCSPRFPSPEPWLPEPERWQRFSRRITGVQISCCFQEIWESAAHRSPHRCLTFHASALPQIQMHVRDV